MARHIVVTTDFSEQAERAFAPAAALAKDLGAEVTLLHVVEDVPVIPHGAPLAAPLAHPQTGARVQAAKQRMAEVAARFPGGAKVAVEIGSEVADSVAEFAEANGADLIVLASHGRSGLRRFVLGSVAEHILRRATRPVLVYPPPKAD